MSTNFGVAVENTVMPASILRIAARFNRALRGDDAHAAVFRRTRGGASARNNGADYGNAKTLLRVFKASGGRGVARDNEQLHVAANEPCANLLHETIDLVLAAGAIGTSRCIAKIYDGFLGQLLGDFARHRKAAKTGIEDTDRGVIKRPV